MLDFWFPVFPLNSIFYYMNGTRNKSIQIDTMFKYIFILAFLENVFLKVHKIDKMLL